MTERDESTQAFFDLLETAQDLIWAIDITGQYTFVNQASRRIYGYEPREMIGRSFKDFLAPEPGFEHWKDSPLFDRLLKNSYGDCETEQIRKDGTTVHLQLHAIALHDQTGRVVGATGTAVEIGDRLQPKHQSQFPLQLVNQDLEAGVETPTAELVTANQQLQTMAHQSVAAHLWQGEAQLHLALEARIWLLESVVVNSRDAVLITEAKPIAPPGPPILYVNEAFTRITGYASEEVLGKTPQILQGIKTDRAQLDKIRQALERGDSIQMELILYRKDQSEFWVELEVMPIANQQGDLTHLVSVHRDISEAKRDEVVRKWAEAERKQIEENMRRALEREKELNELKSRFVSMVSHEFRTPLSTILCSTELLENYGQQWAEEKRLIRLVRIKDAVKRMSLLLNNVLTIGKAEAGKLPFRPAPLDLVEFCQHLIDEMQPEAPTPHTLTYLPMCHCVNAELDEHLLRHILSNLISNAMKYSPQGGTIQLELSCTASEVSFRVQDQGIGIPIADQEKLFAVFQRGSNVGAIAGTGLGLSIVKQCVDLHRGRIAVASTIGLGTLFTVTLPLHSQIAAHEAASGD